MCKNISALLDRAEQKPLKLVSSPYYDHRFNCVCPSCSSYIGYIEGKSQFLFGAENRFCWNCGQALDWSEQLRACKI